MKDLKKSKDDLKKQIEEEIRTGMFDLPDNSVLIPTYTAGDQSLMPIKLSFENGYKNHKANTYLDFEMTINPKELIHNCTCHKLAALCFFEWTQDGKFKQTPPIKTLPQIKYLVLGMVEDIHVGD